jgi:calcium-dependent protein kinase
MLCGYPPFAGKSEDEILKKVKIGKYKFDPDDWDKVSEEAKMLIKKMLTLDPTKRLSAHEAMNDPWVQKLAPSQPLNVKTLQTLGAFQSKNKLKQSISAFIMNQIVS